MLSLKNNSRAQFDSKCHEFRFNKSQLIDKEFCMLVLIGSFYIPSKKSTSLEEQSPKGNPKGQYNS